MCGRPSHPGRALNGLRVEGRKEGRWRRPSHRATPARIPPPKGPGETRECLLSGLPRRATSRALTRFFARSFSPTSTGDRPSPSVFLSSSPHTAPVRRGRPGSPAFGCLRLNSRSGRRKEEEEEEEDDEEKVEKVQAREKGEEGANEECRFSRVGRGTKKTQLKRRDEERIQGGGREDQKRSRRRWWSAA